MKKGIILFLALFAFNLQAQVFDDDIIPSSPEKPIIEEKKPEPVAEVKPFFIPQLTKTEAIKKPAKVAPAVKRGRTTIKRVLSKGEQPAADDDQEIIFLYMENFKISRMASVKTTCSMRFFVVTNLNQKLSALSLKLTWPKISTNLSFNDVAPNTSTYFDYTLLGDGCYSMDTIPNLEVNVCRIKGLSQEQCSAKIRWVK